MTDWGVRVNDWLFVELYMENGLIIDFSSYIRSFSEKTENSQYFVECLSLLLTMVTSKYLGKLTQDSKDGKSHNKIRETY